MDSGKLATIVAREYLERVRSKWFVIATLLAPFFLLLLLLLPAIMGERERRNESGTIRVLDATPDSVGVLIMSSLRGGISGDTARAEWRAIPDSAARASVEAAAEADVISGKIVGYLLVEPEGIGRGQLRYAGRNTSALLTMQQLEGTVTRAVLTRQLEATGIAAERSRSLANQRVRITTERLSSRGRETSGRVGLFFALGVAVTLYLTIFIHGTNVMRGVLEEKQTRVAEVVLSSVSSDTLLLGKVLGIGGVGFTQIIVWTLSSLGLMAIRAPLFKVFGLTADSFSIPDVTLGLGLIILVSFLLGFLFYAALFAAVGAMVSTDQDAQQAQLPVVLLLVLSMAMVQGIFTNPEGSLATLLTLLPFSAPIALPFRLSLSPVPWVESIGSLVILALTSILATLAAARVYRTGVLMYGKRASLREAWRWMRAK